MALSISIKTSALLLLVLAFSVDAHVNNEKCSSEVTGAVAQHFRLKDLDYESQKIVTEHCKNWSTDTARTIALFVYDDSPNKTLLLAIVDQKTNMVLSSYSGSMPEEDAVTRVGQGSARLDTAPYVLSRRIRAFGVVFDTAWLPCAVSGGAAESCNCSSTTRSGFVRSSIARHPFTTGAERPQIASNRAIHSQHP